MGDLLEIMKKRMPTFLLIEEVLTFFFKDASYNVSIARRAK
jgi:hypothetical protein